MQGKVVHGGAAEGLGELLARPVCVGEVLRTGEEVEIVVDELRQER